MLHRHSRWLLGACAAIALFCVLGTQRSMHSVSKPAPAGLAGDDSAAFVPNLGQWDGSHRFAGRFGPLAAFLTDDGWTVTVQEPRPREAAPALPHGPAFAAAEPTGRRRGVAVRFALVGAQGARLEPEHPLPGLSSYFLGNDRARWRTGVPRYASVCYRSVYDGVDVRVRAHEARFEYDLCLRAGAELEQVRVRVSGAERLTIDASGSLVVHTALGPITQPVPRSWAGEGEARRAVDCQYRLLGGDEYGFVAAGRDGGEALLVDPGLVYSTFLGSAGTDTAQELSVDQAGILTLSGWTDSLLFPTTPGAFDTFWNGADDVFVSRLDPSKTGTAQLLWSTYLGGSGPEVAYGMDTDAAGVVTVVGFTASTDFPTTANALSTSHQGGIKDGYVAQLDARLSGSAQLVYSTFLGGLADDEAYRCDVNTNGLVGIVGETYSYNFPITPATALKSSYSGAGDALITVLDPTQPQAQQLVFSTFMHGGNPAQRQWASGIILEDAGSMTILGSSDWDSLPTTPNAYRANAVGGWDAFVMRIDPSLPAQQRLLYSTFFGGTARDYGDAMSFDRTTGEITICGYTESGDLPTTPGAFSPYYQGPGYSGDGFVARFAPTQSGTGQLRYSTYFGGNGSDTTIGIAVDSSGLVTISGYTTATNLPATRGAVSTAFQGGAYDAFVARLDPNRSGSAQLYYATYVGSPGYDIFNLIRIAMTPDGSAWLSGRSDNAGFPTTPTAYDKTHNSPGRLDATISLLDLLPTGVSIFGTSSPGCKGVLPSTVSSMPFVGNSTFEVICSHAPPQVAGALGLSFGALSSPFPLLGTQLWLDPNASLLVLPAVSALSGMGYGPLPIPSDGTLVGATLYTQMYWVGPSSPPPCPPAQLSASYPLQIVIQP